ncbi:CDP-glycerol glycerophosphotransferase family protein [Citrobacter sp. RHBSTW-00678]|uniref:CDP-glycerol glycerophosphotransferase family protein n=1 Tax=Citrobacter sp. RHBSTW-00678 TaxID=2742661 RepID=UPI0015EAB9E1|nr:CDP-glycerol glycerophosphotransferase family protein [Citrobacter sp. RHBSTW-00678]QLV86154.1 CDP-glycerol glycerophosphotransferase family protein [Citrobacter sp. RHBSTW-00678]
MNKKVKKLINNPKLFFGDMLEKQKNNNKVFKAINKIKVKSLEKSYNIILVIDPSMEEVESWVENTMLKFSCYHKYVNFILIDLNFKSERCSLLMNKKSVLSIYDIENPDDYKKIHDELINEFSLFIWGGDILGSEYLSAVDDHLSSKENKDCSQSIIFTPIASSHLSYDSNSIFLKKNNNSNLSASKVVYDSLYGKVIPTHMLRSVLRTIKKFPIFDYNGSILLSDIISNNSGKCVLSYIDSAIYKLNEHGVITPSRGYSWESRDLFTDSFTSMVDNMLTLIENRPLWDVMLKKLLLSILVKYIKKGMSNQSLLDSLTSSEKKVFIEKFNFAVNLVGRKCIQEYTISIAEHLKIGLYNIQGIQCVSKYIDLIHIDTDKNSILLRYYSSSVNDEVFVCNNKLLVPDVDKYIGNILFGMHYYYERRVWLKLDKLNPDVPLIVLLNGAKYKIKGQDRKIYDELTYRKILAIQEKIEFKFDITERYRGSWILMDRDNQADDNAEHLYRYLKEKRQDIDAWFVIQKSSHDWNRLTEDGFNLLAYGSKEHESALMSCSRVISSHAAQFATDYFKDKRMLWKKFIFLQHGIIHNDQSSLFRPDWKKFDIFLTSAYGEYNSIVNDFSSYKFTAKEVALTGLPRHDALVKSSIETEKMILVMPTWRPALLGKVINGTERELLTDFNKSEYAVAWFEFLNDPRLAQYASKNGYKIVFFPHANIQPYLNEYKLPEHVDVLSHASGSIQDLFLKAAIMVTDYSSVAFEMAYINKPVCYYQFDEDKFFRVGHYNKGYFSYRENGFGPVSEKKDDIIDFIINSIDIGCEIQSPYVEKVAAFFPHRDGRCCERVVKTIESLDLQNIDEHLLFDAGISKGHERTLQWAKRLYKYGYHSSAVRYLTDINEDMFSSYNEESLINLSFYIDALIMCGDINKASTYLDTPGSLSNIAHDSLSTRYHIVRSILYEVQMNDSINLIDSYDSCIYKSLFSRNSIHEIKNEIDIDSLSESIYKDALEINDLDDVDNCVIFTLSVIRLKLYELSGRSDDLINEYRTISASGKENIIAKYLYLNALFKLNKWSAIYNYIGNDRMLQGREGITKFAACYFMGIRGSREKISRVEDFGYLFDDIENIPDDCIVEFFKYYLYIERDFSATSKIIDVFYDKIPPKIVEDYAVKLCKISLSNSAYVYLQRADITTMSVRGLKLLGDLAMAYGDYKQATDSFKQAYLSRLPVSDAELFEKLSLARKWLERQVSYTAHNN